MGQRDQAIVSSLHTIAIRTWTPPTGHARDGRGSGWDRKLGRMAEGRVTMAWLRWVRLQLRLMRNPEARLVKVCTCFEYGRDPECQTHGWWWCQ
jgi:hypothetical protein